MNRDLLLVKGASVFFLYLVPVVIVIHNGVAVYGRFAEIIAFISLISAISLYGQDRKILQDRKEEMNYAIQVSLLILLIFMLSPLIVIFNPIEGLANLFFIYLLILMQGVIYLNSAMFKVKGRILLNEMLVGSVKPIIVIFSTLVLSFSVLSFEDNFLTVILFQLAVLLAYQILYLVRRRVVSVRFEFFNPLRLNSLALLGLGTVVFNYIDVLIAAQFLSYENVGLYSIGAKIGIVPLVISSLLYQTLIRRIREFGKHSVCLIQSIRHQIKISLTLSFLVYLAFLFASDEVASKLDLSSQELFIVVSLIFLGNIFSAGLGPCFMIANIHGYAKRAGIVVLSGLFLIITLSLIMIPVMGVIGMALSYSVAVFFMNLFVYQLIRREMGFRYLW